MIIVAYTTIMSGLVLRYYNDLEAANQGDEVMSAGREGVTVLGPVDDEWRTAATVAHGLLISDYDRNYEQVRAMATHRPTAFMGREVEPIPGRGESK